MITYVDTHVPHVLQMAFQAPTRASSLFTKDPGSMLGRGVASSQQLSFFLSMLYSERGGGRERERKREREGERTDSQVTVAIAVRPDLAVGADEEAAALAAVVPAVVLALVLGVGEARLDGLWDAEGLCFFNF